MTEFPGKLARHDYARGMGDTVNDAFAHSHFLSAFFTSYLTTDRAGHEEKRERCQFRLWAMACSKPHRQINLNLY